jgi:hypothetical protein
MKTITDVLWLVSGGLWVPLWLIINVCMRCDPKWLRWWGNRVDNLPDAIKEFLHCCKIPFIDYQLNLAFMMKNRSRPYQLIRKVPPSGQYYQNCDPEDKSALPV